LVTASRRAEQSDRGETVALDVAGQNVVLRFGSRSLRQAILPALAHLECRAPAAAPIVFDLCDGAATGCFPPPPPFGAGDYHRYGQRAIAHDGAVSLMHAPGGGLLFAYDRSARHGIFWTTDAAQLSIYEQAAPLQTLFHWALAEYGWQIVHAAAVGTAQGGVLLIGNSGAGKSTTALSCLARQDLQYLCDDKCLVRLEPEPQAFALFSSGKLKADMLVRLPQFQAMLAGWDDRPHAGKGLVFLHPAYAPHMVKSFPIRALVIPSVTNRAEAALHATAAGSAFRLLGPSTVIWLPGAEADNYRFTAELVRRLPCHRLDLALEPQQNVAALRELLGRL
jgi:hypothetical protein